MNNIIEFDKEYDKLRGRTNDCAKLVEVIKIRPINLSNEFIYYDTLYTNRNGSVGECSFFVKHSLLKKYLLLIFQCDGNKHIFLTVRKNNKENRIKYINKQGQYFSINITEAKS